jgi:hypothetical protein
MPEEPSKSADFQAADRETKKTVIWLRAIGNFLRATAEEIVKAAIGLGSLAVYANAPDKVPVWVPVVVCLSAFAFGIFQNIYIKTSWITIDLRKNKTDVGQPDLPSSKEE